MNKRGNIIFGATVGIFIFIVGVMFIPYMTDVTDNARINLQCSNMSISDGNKLACLENDIDIPYFIWFFISFSLAVFAGSLE